jgi:SAM-dependent methyltransferase
MSIYQDGTYLRHVKTWHTEDSAFKAQHVLNAMIKHGIHPLSIGEVGCGAGRVLEIIQAEFSAATCVGWDVSPQAIEMARKHAPQKIAFVCGDIVTAAPHYDVLLSLDVFEHVPDYLGFLRSLRTLAQWHIFHIPLEVTASSALRTESLLHARTEVGHLHHFCEATAMATLADCGYKIVDRWLTAGALASPPGRLRTRVANAIRRLLPPVWCARLLGGYSLLVVCQSSLP